MNHTTEPTTAPAPEETITISKRQFKQLKAIEAKISPLACAAEAIAETAVQGTHTKVQIANMVWGTASALQQCLEKIADELNELIREIEPES